MNRLIAITIVLLGTTLLQADSNDNHSDRADSTSLAISGGKLTHNQAGELEATVAKHPNDLSARTELLGYYFVSRHNSPDAKAAHQKYVLWFIKNHPDAEITGTPYCSLNAILDADGYSQAKRIWLDQIHSHEKDSSVLGHAANFFLLNDRATAEDLLKKAQKLEPNSPEWPDRLAHLYTLQRDKEGAKKALDGYEKAQSADQSDVSKFHRLDQLAKTAFDAGEIDKATRYANESLQVAKKYPNNWDEGNSIHQANIVLGRIALKNGDIKTAKQYLLKAGHTPGSPQLDSFGPNMSLAKDLLEAGERDTVLQYFQLCKKFWQMDRGKLDDWAKQVKAGEIPPFGANLVY
jgi:tetratricopeptide (TPR) repeat protein